MSKKKQQKKFHFLILGGWSRDFIKEDLGISNGTYYNWLKQDTAKPLIEAPPISVVTEEDLLELRDKVYKTKVNEINYNKGVIVSLPDNKAIAVMHFGDMHLDSDGMDMKLIARHLNLLRNTEGAYGGNIGDVTNNWVGFLGRLHGEQHTTIEEAYRLAEKVLSGTRWLYTIVGNHDHWNAGDYLVKHNVHTGVIGDDIRLELTFPKGSMTSVHARHFFKGGSMYNNAQGAVKEAMLGSRDDIVVGGHIHTLGYSIVTQSELRKLSHCIQLGSYKKIDPYATVMGFKDGNLSPCVVTVIDPSLPENHVDRIKVFFDAEVGIRYLKFLRGE